MGSKAVFFDIDGTIWDWRRNIPDSFKTAIKMLRANGHMAFLCSGRARGNIRSAELLDIGFDGIVAACGGYVEIDNEVLYEYHVPKEVVKLIVETVNECKMPVVLEGSKRHWVSDKGFENDAFVALMMKELADDAVLFNTYSDDMDINKFAADVLRMTDYETIKKRLGDYFVFLEHGLTSDFEDEQADSPNRVLGVIETVPKGISKADGVAMVCRELGILKEDTYAVGDSVNDIDMFAGVAHSICMGNGSDAAKAAAEYVTDDIMQDGVFNALRYYGLI